MDTSCYPTLIVLDMIGILCRIHVIFRSPGPTLGKSVSLPSFSSMATTFEYPPAFARHRPLQFAGNPAQLGRLQFEYHFLLTRLKIVVDSVFRSTDVAM